MLKMDRLGQAGDESGREILAVGGLLLQRAKQDAGRAGRAALTPDVLHEFLARFVRQVVLDHGSVKSQARP